MSVGYNVDKAVLDGRAGGIVLTLRDSLADAQSMKAWLDAKTDAELEAAPFNYTAADVSLLRAAFTDLNNLAKVAHGQQAQPGASDFFFSAHNLLGLQ